METCSHPIVGLVPFWWSLVQAEGPTEGAVYRTDVVVCIYTVGTK